MNSLNTKPETKLKEKIVLITAGPTIEKIDPVRYISNYSTGKMGYALAEEIASRGAKVILVSGPVSIKAINSNITTINIQSADEMFEECSKIFDKVDIAIFAAAVADYKPTKSEKSKIKRNTDNLTIELIPNKDIAKELGKIKKSSQITVGFALETDNEIENAFEKIKKKNFDFIVLNSLRDKGAGFGHDTNKIAILFKDGNCINHELKNKSDVASDISNELEKYY